MQGDCRNTKMAATSSTPSKLNLQVEEYLPKQLTEEEVIEIIKRVKGNETNMGKIIGLTAKEVGNSFDKKKIAALVKGVLSCK